MTYAESIDFLIHKTPQFSHSGINAYNKGFDKIKALLKVLGHPERLLPFIHVAGTNGKGSTCHIIAAYLTSQGYKVGLHTSPHLKDIRERFLINGSMIKEEYITDFVNKYHRLILEIKPSFFEITVAMAISFFKKEKVDIVILETGLGGRYDSTNIVESILSIITNISLDHVAILGDTIEKIAYEKAGIIKKNSPVILGLPENKKALEIIQSEAHLKNTPLYKTSELSPEIIYKIENKVKSLGIPYFQFLNIQTVWKSLSHLQFKDFIFNPTDFLLFLNDFFSQNKMIGRWQIIQNKPLIILDVGHNVAAIQMQEKALLNLNFEQLHIIIGFMKDKEVEAILSELPEDAQYYFTEATTDRALKSEILAKIAEKQMKLGKPYTSTLDAWMGCKKNLKPNDLLIITGSFPIIEDFLMIYENQNLQNNI